MYVLLFAFIMINIILGTGLFILRDNSLIVVALIISIIASGTLFLIFINRIASKIGKNIEVINKGQLNKNVKKTNISMFNGISSKVNDFIFKVRGLIASFGAVSKKVIKDAHEVEKQAEAIKYSSGEIASTIQNVAESVSNQAEYTLNMMGTVQNFAGMRKTLTGTQKQALT